MKYLKFLNLIPLVMYFIADRLGVIVINPVTTGIVVALALMNIVLCDNLKDFFLSSLMLIGSGVIGIILMTYFDYYFINADPETPIVGAYMVIVYAEFMLFFIALGIGVMVLKNLKKKRDNNERK